MANQTNAYHVCLATLMMMEQNLALRLYVSKTVNTVLWVNSSSLQVVGVVVIIATSVRLPTSVFLVSMGITRNLGSAQHVQSNVLNANKKIIVWSAMMDLPCLLVKPDN